MNRRIRAGIALALLVSAILGLAWLLPACQGTSPGVQETRPRSRQAAGEQEALPNQAVNSQRFPISTDGGVLEYRLCTVSIPRGAFPEPIFLEISIPDEPPRDVISDCAYQVNPDGLELAKDGVITIGYYDDDIPIGKSEEELVIVHQVNNVWVELNESKVHIYNNTVEAPIRFLGLYALRIASEDPRKLNTAPVASFQFSTEPFPEAVGKPFEEAQAETAEPEETAPTEAEAAEAAKQNVNEMDVDELANVEGISREVAQAIVDHRNHFGPFEYLSDLRKVEGIDQQLVEKLRPVLTTGKVEPGTEQTPAEQPAGEKSETNETKKEQPKEQPKGQAWVLERRVVAGPDDDAVSGTAGNVAEGSAPEAAAAGEGEQPQEITSELPEVTVYFDASGSYDPDGKVVQYDWDFDSDGIFDYTSHSSPYAQHVFRYNGDYSVVLKVTDNGRYAQSGYGTGVMKVRSALAEPKPLAANISCFPPYGPVPLTVNFASTVTGGAPPYAFTWTFSDGSESRLANPFTTYPEIGNYIVRFKVQDVQGAELTGSLPVQSCDSETPGTPQPRMDLDISPYADKGYAPLTAKFQLKVDRAAQPVTYRVTYGDEGPDEPETVTKDINLSHYYGNSGFYLVKVIATDADLRTASTFATVHVLSPDIQRDFTVSEKGLGSDPFSFGHDMRIVPDYTEASPRTVRFKPDSAPKPADQLSFQWDFGDGTYATEEKPSHTYARDGVYEVRLTASDGLERWRHRIWLPVSAEEPAVAIQLPPYVEGPAPLHLDLDAIVTRGEQPFRYDWILGENRRSDSSTHFAFQLPGDYEVRLDVYDKWNQPIHSPAIEVKVRPGPVDYRMPLAVIEPVAGSTRAAVVEFNGSNPLPLSSPHVEGPVRMLDLSADGQLLAIVGEEGMLVKRIGNAAPVVAFLPAAAEISAVRALNGDAALISLQGAGGTETYLLRPDLEPQLIGGGELLAASGDGGQLVLGPEPGYGETRARLYGLDVLSGQLNEGQELPALSEAALSVGGRALIYIDDQMRLVRRDLSSGDEEYLATSEDNKHGLAISADGTAVAFVSELGSKKQVIYGRYTMEGVFRLASVTDTTGFYSDYLHLSDDGKYLLGYGSRRKLLAMIDAAEGKAGAQAAASQPAGGGVQSQFEAALAEDEAASTGGFAASTEGAAGVGNAVLEGGEPDADGAAPTAADEEYVRPRPPAERERLGVIRLNLSRAPDSWRITTVSAEFVTEASAIFDVAGPFGR